MGGCGGNAGETTTGGWAERFCCLCEIGEIGRGETDWGALDEIVGEIAAKMGLLIWVVWVLMTRLGIEEGGVYAEGLGWWFWMLLIDGICWEWS